MFKCLIFILINCLLNTNGLFSSTNLFHEVCQSSADNIVYFHTSPVPERNPNLQAFLISTNSSGLKKINNNQCIANVINQLMKADLRELEKIPPLILKQGLSLIKTQDLFDCFYRYSNQIYLNHIRHRQGYEEFILTLHKKINVKKSDYRKSLRDMPGFSGKDGFTMLINNEAARIKKEREQRTLFIQQEAYAKAIEAKRQGELERVYENVMQHSLKAYEAGNKLQSDRYKK